MSGFRSSSDTVDGFRYVMGVLAVAEPTTWLALLPGLGTWALALALALRRRNS